MNALKGASRLGVSFVCTKYLKVKSVVLLGFTAETVNFVVLNYELSLVYRDFRNVEEWGFILKLGTFSIAL